MYDRLESFVTRLMTDPVFRAEALGAPERVVASHGLSGAEGKGAVALCRSMATGREPSQPAEGFWL